MLYNENHYNMVQEEEEVTNVPEGAVLGFIAHLVTGCQEKKGFKHKGEVPYKDMCVGMSLKKKNVLKLKKKGAVHQREAQTFDR